MKTPFEIANALAQQAFGMAPIATTQWPLNAEPEPSNAQSVIPSGLYEYQYASANGLIIDCHLEYEAEEAQTYSAPGQPESINLIYALVNGIDVSDVLCESIKNEIEEEAAQSMTMDKWNSDYDRGEALYLDRLAA